MAGRRKARKFYEPDIEDLLDGGPLHSRKAEDFRPYQDWMAELCYQQKVVILAAEMGLGKTAAVLRALRKLLDEFEVRRVLVIAPMNVAIDTWPEEIRTWDFSRDLSFSVIIGTEEERIEAAKKDVEIHIINRENIVWLWRFWTGRRWPYDTIVYDEASRLKAGETSTKPTQRKDGSFSVPKLSEFGALTRARRLTSRVIEMTGTPSPNGLQDLWGPAYFADGGVRLGSKKTAFMNRWFTKNPYSKKITPQDHAFAEITERMQGLMYSLKEKDYLSLPPLIKSERVVHLRPDVMAKYKRLEREFILAEHDVEAVNSGVLANKLLQLANGSIYNDDGDDVFLHDQKLDELESIYREAAGEPILIAYSFKFDLARIVKRFPQFRIYGSTKNDMRDWNAGRLPGMIVHPASAAHGLNFQYGGSIAVWYGLTWSLELYLQFIKRLHRSGQKADRVFLHHIVARGTYDERVMRVLAQKEIGQSDITDTVRVDIDRVMRELKVAA